MPLKLSHSQREMYAECSQKYKFRYIDKLKTRKIYSSLFFGNALDAAFSALLLEKKREPTQEELDILLKSTPEKEFEKLMRVTKNDLYEEVVIPEYLETEYYFSDFQPELINKKHLQHLKEKFPDLTDNFFIFWDKCKERIQSKQILSNEDRIVFNYMNWLSLSEKGKLMIDAYRQQVLPLIEEVFDIQKRINITNDTGDVITGLIDFTATFKGGGGVRYISDNKSSSKKYKEDSVRTSDQLATYSEAEGNPYAAYVVVIKELFKKAPKIRTQIIKDKISEELLEKVFANFEEMVYSIEAGKFEKNENACFSFGKLCPYYKLCKYGNSEGLVKK